MKERPTNIAAELLAQHLPPEETSQTLPVLVKGIGERTGNSGRIYHVVEYYDPHGVLKKVTVWDKKLLDHLTPGAKVDLTLVRNDRGFWNLAAAVPSTPAVEPLVRPTEIIGKLTEIPPNSPKPPAFQPTDLDPRAYRMTSMNALTNAVNFVIAFKDLLKPVNIDEAFALVDHYRSLMIDFHQTDHAGARDTQASD